MIWRYCPHCIQVSPPGNRRCATCDLRPPVRVLPVLRAAAEAAFLTGGGMAVEELVVHALGGEAWLKLLIEEREWTHTRLATNDVDFAIATGIESARRIMLRAQEVPW